MSNDMGQSQAMGLTVVGVTISLVLWAGLARVAATNERLAASNERLADSKINLAHSNKRLATALSNTQRADAPTPGLNEGATWTCGNSVVPVQQENASTAEARSNAQLAQSNERLAASNDRLAAAMVAQQAQAARTSPMIWPPTRGGYVIVHDLSEKPLKNPFVRLPRPHLLPRPYPVIQKKPGREVVTAGRSVRVRERVRPLQQPDW